MIDQILESMNLDPLRGIEFMNPIDVYSEADEAEINGMYTEAVSGATSQNAWTKIINFIKKAFDWIAKKLGKLVDWFKRLFSGKTKMKKTPDQIMSEVSGGGKAAVSSAGDKGSVQSAGPQPASSGQPQQSQKLQSVSVPIKSSPKSKVAPPDHINVLMKNLEVQIGEGGQVTLRFGDARKFKTKVKGKYSVRPQNAQFAACVVFGAKSDGRLLQEMEECIQMFVAGNIKAYLNSIGDINHELNNLWTNITSYGHVFAGDITTFTINDLEKAQARVSKISQLIDGIIDAKKADPSVLGEMNTLATSLMIVQFGLNEFAANCAAIFSIDAAYIGTITDWAELGRFVSGMITNGVPAKYVGYNAYLAADANLNSAKAADVDTHFNPIWGQSRLVLYPKDRSIIYKVALSGLGIIGNNTEAKVTNDFKKYGMDQYIAACEQLAGDGAVEKGQRADMSSFDEKNAQHNQIAAKLESQIKGKCWTNNLGYFVYDVHAGNIGYVGNNIVVVDYGAIARTR